ncbi:MAG: hypothetical protein ACKOAZ_06650 [Ilumatobacteraceae bacterium]
MTFVVVAVVMVPAVMVPIVPGVAVVVEAVDELVEHVLRRLAPTVHSDADEAGAFDWWAVVHDSHVEVGVRYG